MSKTIKYTLAVGVIIIAVSVAYYYKTSLDNKKVLEKLQTEAQQQEASKVAEATTTAPVLTLDEEIEKLVEEERQTLPIMLDDKTQETAITSSGREITMSLKVIGHYVITQAWLDKNVAKKTADTLCNAPQTRYLLENGVVFTVKYFYANDKLGGSITIKLSDCE